MKLDMTKGLHLLLLVALTQGKCVTKKAADPGSGSKVPCVFPFQYKGVIYNTCTGLDSDGGKLWCSTRVDKDGKHISGEGNWGYCSKGCPVPPGCPDGWARLSTGCYLFNKVEDGISQSNAEEMCGEFGGYLAEIETMDEQEALEKFYEREFVASECRWTVDVFWIGATKVDKSGAWVWSKSGQPVNRTFSNWYDRALKKSEDNKHCAGILTHTGFAKKLGLKNYKWGPLPCQKQKTHLSGNEIIMNALCEKDVDIKEGSLLEVPIDREPIKKIEFQENGCFSGWIKIGSGCYLFKVKASTRNEADNICQSEGGYVVEIGSQEEQDALTSYFEKNHWKMNNSCSNYNYNTWWIGAKDRQPTEGSWAWGYTKKPLEFTAWSEDEPNNYGGKEPGENCAIAGLNKIFNHESNAFLWHDVSCFVSGFKTEWSDTWSGVTLNPLCEQFSEEIPAPQSSLQCPENTPLADDCQCGEESCSKGQSCVQGICVTGQCSGVVTVGKCQCGSNICVDGQTCQSGQCSGCGTGWTQLDAGCYKFHEVEGGTTKMEADKICKDNGGFLVEIDTSEEKEMLEKLSKERRNKLEESWLYSLLNFNKIKKILAGEKLKKSAGWWIGATDEKVEGKWVWGNSGNPVMLSFWYKWNDFAEPNNDNWGIGGEDCAVIIKRTDLDPEEKGEENFGWIDTSCYRGIVPHFHIQLNPLCEKSV